MDTLTIKGERGSKDVTKIVRIRKVYENGNYSVEWGTGKRKRIGYFTGTMLCTMGGRYTTVISNVYYAKVTK